MLALRFPRLKEDESRVVPEQFTIAGAYGVEIACGVLKKEQSSAGPERSNNAGTAWRVIAPEMLAVTFSPGVDLAIVLCSIKIARD